MAIAGYSAGRSAAWPIRSYKPRKRQSSWCAPRNQPPTSPQSLQRILVPLDGSALAEQALPLAIELGSRARRPSCCCSMQCGRSARHLGICSRCIGRPRAIDFPAPGHAQALQHLHGVAERWHAPEIAVLPMVASGEPAQAIVDTAANEHADLIVMATHGYTGVRRWALGSVADKVLHASTTPLLLVRAQSQELER